MTVASTDAIGLRFNASGACLGFASHGCDTVGSASTARSALRTPVALPCGTRHRTSEENGKSSRVSPKSGSRRFISASVSWVLS